MSHRFGKVCVKHPELHGERTYSGNRCVACVSEQRRRAYAANPAPKRIQAARWYAENKERAAANSRRWKEANPEKVQESKRQWKRSNIESVRAANRTYARHWTVANYERKLVANSRRRAAKRGAVAALDAIGRARYQELHDIARARTAQTGVAHHVDHDVPLARGGLDHPDNMMVLPASINTAKGARHLSTRDFLFS